MHEHLIKWMNEIIKKQKEECHICYNLGHNTLELYNVVVQIQLTTSKRNVIPSIANYVYELRHEYSNDLRKLGNIRKIPNLGGDIAQCLVPLPEIKFGNSSQKACTNRYQGFSCTVHFFWISLFCSKYLVRDCSS